MPKPITATGWTIDPAQREQLLKDHPPKFARIVANHITLALGDRVPGPVKASIVGRTDDESGVEAMVVTVDGTVDRPDGSIFHITWSLGEGRSARESNDVLKQRGWKELDHPIPLTVTPAAF